MEPTSLLAFLLIGVLAGWIAAKLMRGAGLGVVGNLVIGSIGAIIGGYVFRFIGISAGGFLGSLLTATVGAALLLYVARVLKQA